MKESLICPFCKKEVGLSGMFVAHTIKCGQTELARKDALLERSRIALVAFMDETLVNDIDLMDDLNTALAPRLREELGQKK